MKWSMVKVVIIHTLLETNNLHEIQHYISYIYTDRNTLNLKKYLGIKYMISICEFLSLTEKLCKETFSVGEMVGTHRWVEQNLKI